MVPTVEGSKGTTVHYVPFSVIKSIHEQTHSAMPDAPVRPHVPKRHPIRDAVRRWRDRRTPPAVEPATVEPAMTEPAVTEPATTEPAVTEPTVIEPVVIQRSEDLCQAEVRDRGTTPAGVARAC
jgi:hypothetical protein